MDFDEMRDRTVLRIQVLSSARLIPGVAMGKGGNQQKLPTLTRPKSLENLKYVGKISYDDVKKHRERPLIPLAPAAFGCKRDSKCIKFSPMS